MRARHIRKLRKKILQNDYYNNRLEKYKKELGDLKTFYTFECSEFFRGEKVAKYNTKIYYEKITRVERRFDHYVNKVNYHKTKQGKRDKKINSILN